MIKSQPNNTAEGQRHQRSHLLTGAALAIVATIVWSGNFIVARGVIHDIPPVSLALFRWLTASVMMLPLAWKQIVPEWPLIKKHWLYFFWTALFGISLFNTFVYVAGHYSPAINLALIGTTSSPIMAILLARIFLKEKITFQRVAGLSLCITGILYLLSKGSFQRLMGLQFGKGDAWILLGAFCFAVYNILVRRKPSGVSPQNFLFTLFVIGSVLLLPAYGWENSHSEPVHWNNNLVGVVLYLGLGTSVIAYLCWNAAIGRLGAARTALFGNLIPIFASLEALILLHEKITVQHFISGFLVVTGLLIANLPKRKLF